jgi:hypothetical protein
VTNAVALAVERAVLAGDIFASVFNPPFAVA